MICSEMVGKIQITAKEWIGDNLKDLVKQDKLDELLLELKPRLENNYNTFLKFAKINRNNLEHLLDK
jgi:hypothetical protein